MSIVLLRLNFVVLVTAANDRYRRIMISLSCLRSLWFLRKLRLER